MTLKMLSAVLVCIFAGPLWPWPGEQAIACELEASSCSESEVQAAIDSARDGDVVTVPPGSCTWEAGIAFKKGITLQGAGIGQTVVTDETPDTLIRMDTVVKKSYRITGFTIQRGVAKKTGQDPRFIWILGDSTAFRVDHNEFMNMRTDHPPTRAIHTQGSVLGVIDHNSFLSSGGMRSNVWIQHPR